MSNLTVPTWRTYSGNSDAPPTDLVQAAINAAEEAIAIDVGRGFVLAGAASARVFAAREHSSMLTIDDCTTVTVVVNDGATEAASGYQLEPLNGKSSAGAAVPYTEIRLLHHRCWAHRGGDALITVTATWGWPTLPARYTEATKILTSDILSQATIRNGIVPDAQFGGMRLRANPVVARMISGLMRHDPFGLGG